jgi:hypothetical protein
LNERFNVSKSVKWDDDGGQTVVHCSLPFISSNLSGAAGEAEVQSAAQIYLVEAFT